MNPAEMRDACHNSIRWSREFGRKDADAKVTLVLPRGFKPPAGFPRGYLLQVKDNGTQLRSFPAMRLLAWLGTAGAA